MPMPCHMNIIGAKQDNIEGGCEMEGDREGSILVYQFDHKIHIPRDPQKGTPSGKRIHGPMTIVKEMDQASPKIYNALCAGEYCFVELKWYRITPQGEEQHYFTHTLEEAIIVEVEPYTPIVFVAENEPYRHMEKVSFTYKKITWSWDDGSGAIETDDDWTVPNVSA